MEINIVEKDSRLWEQTIAYAESCSWRASSEFARQMCEDCFRGFEKMGEYDTIYGEKEQLFVIGTRR